MRKSLVGCVGMVALVLLCTAGAAFSQVSFPQPRSAMSWGWNPQPAPDSPQSATTSAGSASDSAQAGTQTQTPDDGSKQADKQTNKPTDKLMGDPATTQNAATEGSADQGAASQNSALPSSASSSSDSSSSSSPSSDSSSSSTPSGTTIAVLPPDGTALPTSKTGILPELTNPFQTQPQGLKIGPIFLTDISDSFFYAMNSEPGSPTSTFYGNSLSGTFIYNKQFSQSALTVNAREQFSTSELTPYFNQSVGAAYTDTLSARWSLSATAQFTYFQNSILANPQYLLVPSNNGLVLQNLFALQRASTMYESNSIDFSYAIDGRTHVTLSPILGTTFLETGSSGWTSSIQLGGAIGITRDVSDKVTLGANYTLAHTIATGVSGTPNWNTQSIGISAQYRPAPSWNISGAIAASGQLIAQVWTLSPTGSLRVSKSFKDSSVIFGAYTRTEATAVFVSTGYYSQSDLGYSRKFGQKVTFDVTVGAYQTSEINLAEERGKHAGSFFSYRFMPNLSLSAGYNYANQTGAQSLTLFPLLGTTSSFSVGLNWALGSRPGS